LFLVLAGFGATAACGARTPLFVLGESARDAGVADSVRPLSDAFLSFDTLPPPEDVSFDALPPIDVAPVPDVFVNDCPDAGATLIYVITQSFQLYSFYPPTGAFTQIGLIACPDGTGSSPFSMAVDKQGTAYVVFDPDGQLFQVSTKTAACVATPYAPMQLGIPDFGMGFVGNPSGTGDTLYVAPDGMTTLGTIDTNSFVLSLVGPFGPESVTGAELSGTGDGRLFAFYSILGSSSSAVAQIDPTNAMVIANNNLFDVPQGRGWAFAFWGGSFYLFTADPNGPGSQVTQFNPVDLSQTTVATLPFLITGAGVSTCAPMQ
jgi:hypothetical protein